MAPSHFLALALLCLLALLVVTAALSDIRSRTIANSLNLAIALLALPWWWCLGLTGSDMLWQLATSAIVLIVFASCFAAGMMGGGDVKMLAALALWLPVNELLGLLIWMAIAGGLLTLAMLVQHRLARRESVLEVPYGVAIAGAALLPVTNHILTILGA